MWEPWYRSLTYLYSYQVSLVNAKLKNMTVWHLSNSHINDAVNDQLCQYVTVYFIRACVH